MTISSTVSAQRTGSPCSTASPGKTASHSSTALLTMSLSVTTSPSVSPSPSLANSLSPSPSASPPPSATATLTATPSTTPPPFNCLSNPSGCRTPHISALAPLLLGSPPLPLSDGLAPPVVVSWPVASTPFFILLPVSPSLGEAASATCWPLDTSGSLVVEAAPGQKPCPSSSAPACVSFVSVANVTGKGSALAAGGGTPLPPRFANFTARSTRANASFSTAIMCTVDSQPLADSVAAGLPFPHYGLHTNLPPLPAISMRFSLPLLAAVLRESSTVFGEFVVLGGGVGVGVKVTLPPLETLRGAAECIGGGSPLSAYYANLSLTSPSLWTRWDILSSCAPARDALLAASARQVAPPNSAAAPPSLSATLSGSRHLLLVSSPRAPFPDARHLSVTLGGQPCTINWILPSIASVVSPPLARLCNSTSSLYDAASGDCGLAPLILTVNATDTLPLPAAYPPLLPSAEWDSLVAVEESAASPWAPPASAALPYASPLAAALALLPLPPTLLLAASTSLAPEGTGLRIVTRCSARVDPTFAPPELCQVVNGTQPLVNGTGLQCVWGTGDACLPCPPGALCPGGASLLPLPGYWCPLPSSPPSDLFLCPSPDALQRCPGYTAIASTSVGYGCGVGFRGQVCAACDVGWYSLRGSCARCPQFSVLGLLAPVLVFLSALLAIGCAFAGIVHCALGSPPPRLTQGVLGAAATAAATPARCSLEGLQRVVQPVGSLLAWVWIAAQGLASVFSQAQSLAPPSLGPIYTAVAALQFQGISLNPACFPNAIPFLSFYTALGVVVGCYVAGGSALCCLRWWPAPGSHAASSRWGVGCAELLLHSAALVLCIGYGAITSEIASALVCTKTFPMTVVDYLQTANDGGALLQAFSTLSPSDIPLLLTASRNPLVAATFGLSSRLQGVLPVSVLASDRYQVCGEAAHRHVRPLAAIMCVAFTLFLPLLLLGALLGTGRMKGLRRSGVGRVLACSGGGAAAAAVTLPPTGSSDGGAGCATAAAPLPEPLAAVRLRPTLEAIVASLANSALLQRSAWFTIFEQLQLGVVTGLIAVSKAQLPASQFILCQCIILLGSLVACCIVARVSLFKPQESWKWPVVIMLYLATGTTAIINTLLSVEATRSPPLVSPPARTALSFVPLGLAAITTVVLLRLWWASLLRSRPPPVALPDKFCNNSEEHSATACRDDAAAFVVANPMLIAATPELVAQREPQEEVGLPPPEPRAPAIAAAAAAAAAQLKTAAPPPHPVYQLCDTGDGEMFWLCAETGETEWRLPKGADTVCGWAYSESGSCWLHKDTGEVTRSHTHIVSHSTVRPLPPSKEEAGAVEENQEALALAAAAEHQEAAALAAAAAAAAAAANAAARDQDRLQAEEEAAKQTELEEAAKAALEEAAKVAMEEAAKLEREAADAEALCLQEEERLKGEFPASGDVDADFGEHSLSSHSEALKASPYYATWHYEQFQQPGAMGVVAQVHRLSALEAVRKKK